MSLSRCAPAAIAARATAALYVSTLIGVPGSSLRSRSITGTTRLISSTSEISSKPASLATAPGRVDWPPTSSRSAPSPANRCAWATAASTLASPSPENESGDTLITPMMYVRAPQTNVRGPIVIDAAASALLITA